MNAEWLLAKLGDLGEVNRGRSRHRPRYAEHLYGGPYPFIQTGDIRESGGRITTHQQTYSEAGLAQSRLWPTGTMCITIAANIAETAILTYPACFPDSVVGFIADPNKCSVQFIEFMFRYLRSKIQHEATGSVQDNINLATLERLRFPLPPLLEQRAIAGILGALDDKIELNRRRNRTLEAMARAIFQSWFVDFDPVHAKAAGRPPEGLTPELAALFPARFEDSPLGKIPKGWRVTTLGDEVTANKGLSYKGQYLSEEGVGLPMHNLNSVYEGGGYKHEGLKWYRGEYRPAHLLKPGDVIVTNTEQGFDHLLIGYAAIVPKKYGDTGLFSHHTYRLQPTPESYLPTWFTYLLLRTPVFHELVAGHSNGTTVNMLPLDGLQKPRFVLPPKQLVRQFGKLFEPMQQQSEMIHDENITLAALRDTLLPKLISGELRVKDAERIVGRNS